MDNYKNYYPMVIYNKFFRPEDIDKITLYDLNVNEVKKPQKPSYPTNQNGFSYLLLLTLWLCGCFGILVMFGGFVLESAVLLSFSGLSFLILSEKDKSFNSQLEKYNKELKEYEINLKEYQQLLDANISLESINSSASQVLEFSLKKYHALIQEISEPFDYSSKRGKSEALFHAQLNTYFKTVNRDHLIEILTDRGINPVLGSKFPYSCDLLLKHLNTGILLDIEIDEPYSWDSKNPIHYLKEVNDGRLLHSQYLRDEELSKLHNWTVVRFAEEQVIKYPTYCCDLMYNIIGYMTRDPLFTPKKIELPDGYFIKCWTLEECYSMIKSNYRFKYQ